MQAAKFPKARGILGLYKKFSLTYCLTGNIFYDKNAVIPWHKSHNIPDKRFLLHLHLLPIKQEILFLYRNLSFK